MVIYHPEHVLQHKVIGMASQGIVKFPVQLNHNNPAAVRPPFHENVVEKEVYI